VGLLEGVFYAFMALGLNMVFGVVRMVNIAHGDLIVLGGYLAVVMFSSAHLSVLAAFAVAFPLFFALGVGVYYLLVPKLEVSSDPEMFSFIGLLWALHDHRVGCHAGVWLLPDVAALLRARLRDLLRAGSRRA